MSQVFTFLLLDNGLPWHFPVLLTSANTVICLAMSRWAKRCHSPFLDDSCVHTPVNMQHMPSDHPGSPMAGEEAHRALSMGNNETEGPCGSDL